MSDLTPDILFSDDISHYFDMYYEISNGLRRVQDGVCSPIPWTEFVAWAKVTKTLVRVQEYDMLRQMDLAFCDEMNKELRDFRLRSEEKAKSQIKKK